MKRKDGMMTPTKLDRRAHCDGDSQAAVRRYPLRIIVASLANEPVRNSGTAARVDYKIANPTNLTKPYAKRTVHAAVRPNPITTTDIDKMSRQRGMDLRSRSGKRGDSTLTGEDIVHTPHCVPVRL